MNDDTIHGGDRLVAKDWRCPIPGCWRTHFGYRPPMCETHPTTRMVEASDAEVTR